MFILFYFKSGHKEFEHDDKKYYWAAFLDGLQRVLLIIDDFTLAYRAQVVRDCFILLHPLVGRNVIIIQIIFFFCNNRAISRALIGRQIWSMRVETVDVTLWRNLVYYINCSVLQGFLPPRNVVSEHT